LGLRTEVVEDWRRLHNEELHNLYASPSIIRVIKSRMRKACNILVVKPEGKRPLERSRRREDNIKMARRKIWCKGVD